MALRDQRSLFRHWKFPPAFLQATVFAVSAAAWSSVPVEESIRVASFNVHYIVPHDANDDWEKRKHAVTQVLKDMDADIIAFQEMETFDGDDYSDRNLQLEWVLATTTGYAPAAIGNPASFPTTQPILYRADKFSVVEQGFFFFSETPDRIYSAQWDDGYPYFCSWAHLRENGSGEQFLVFNIHNDYSSRNNRLKTSELVAARIQEINRDRRPTIVLGDFNAAANFREIRILEELGLAVIPPGGSTNRVLGLHLLPAIDHILVSESVQTHSNIKVWREKYDGVYPADHYPISTDVSLSPNQPRP